MKARKANIKRKTTETAIAVGINLDGSGKSDIKTPINFLNHMLTLFSRHGLFDLKVKAAGDIEVDMHHTNEDIGICLGQAIKKALTDKLGIRRFGFSSVPMDEALAEVSLDISGRPFLKFRVQSSGFRAGGKEYSLNYLKQFLQAAASNAGITLHVEIVYGEDSHHIIEAVFKAFGRALKEAVTVDPRIRGILSTKGIL
ncbi:MAG: imidazoleglycerol-phosphate dehydratase [Omnitrophica WOR_2 bacterium RIFCSPLOWO2_12_FULL_46_30]|nr:MAG: imidazoleglycerol-phosphate dehydratase [Omnitrophica WOR_2 bacterium RIFCSPHIGHO2_02_FULL_46_37]OGX41994.1 MAG: imidazoleglycerol-phosphate dehydratase [Omnitrophica WOR_2 bacterium RIFCSPLOWO2_02_FULL_45_28]OGX52440.1 MAG: imidazoleglycerol-phosphate dehydratase [Omnitrophica WOR_2 bacterium RIFCSPLOWO2_12_FULL_46_30]